MALAGLHVVCGFYGAGEHVGVNNYAVFGSVKWSETIASAGKSTQAAPKGPGRPVFRVTPSAASYIATGPTATVDATKAVSTKPEEGRIYVSAGTTVDIYVNDGDVLAWAAA